jgi:imidazolonepropionase-like amidohydrolase
MSIKGLFASLTGLKMDILIKNGKVIEGSGKEPIEKGYVLVSGQKIMEVGQQGEVKVGAGTQVLDATGKTVIPGLIDCHAHTVSGYHVWTYDKYVPREVTKSILRGIKNAERCVKAGVLTVRDAGCGHVGIFELRSALNSGYILGPRLLAAGQPISATGGHGWDMALQADGPYGVRTAVRSLVRWGADCIKFMVTGGAASQYEEMTQVQMSSDELAAGVDEARKKGKRTLAHVCNSEGALMCVEAGIDSIDHGNMLDNRALAAMKKAGSFYVPTVNVYFALANVNPQPGSIFTEWLIRKSKGIVDAHKESFQRAYKMGLDIATGTDFEEELSSLLDGGDPLIAEMELMVKYGMTPLDAIKAATYTSARNLGIEENVGTLQSGRLADIVILDGDPLDDISNLRRVWRVMKEGSLVYEV